MAGVITTGNTPKALWPGVKNWWGRFYAEHEEQFNKLFEIESSSQAFEEDVQVTGFGMAPIKPQGQAIQYDSETQGLIARYIPDVYALGFMVTMEEFSDNLYAKVGKRRTQALAFSMRQTKEHVCANVYGRAFNANYTGADGVELISTSHPTLYGNQSNHIATAADLSEAAVEDVVVQIMGALNDRGLKISINPQRLTVHRSEYFNAHRIFQSTLQYDTALNAINVLKAENTIPGGINVNRYLPNADDWFIKTNCPRGMILMEWWPIKFSMDNDFDTKNGKYAAMERYVPYWTDWRGLYGSPGA